MFHRRIAPRDIDETPLDDSDTAENQAAYCGGPSDDDYPLNPAEGEKSTDESSEEYQHAKTTLATDLIWLAKAGHVIEFADDGNIKRENVWLDLAAIIQQLPQN